MPPQRVEPDSEPEEDEDDPFGDSNGKTAVYTSREAS